MIRVVFMGTPEFAVPSLDALAGHPEFKLVGVVTQPDRKAGRGQTLRKSAIKLRAEELGLPIYQPEKLRGKVARQHLESWEPDVLVVAAYGQILRKSILELAPHGSINVHASLLPRWRGAAPIQYAIRAGDHETGVTIMVMDVGLDSGPMLDKIVTPISPNETGQSLHDKLSIAGAGLLPETLLAYIRSEIPAVEQPDEGITLAPTLKKQEGRLDWSQPATDIDRLVRAFSPWPGTFTMLDGKLVKVIAGGLTDLPHTGTKLGTISIKGKDILVQTGDGLYRIDLIQPAGKKKMSGQAYLSGHALLSGQVFDLD